MVYSIENPELRKFFSSLMQDIADHARLQDKQLLSNLFNDAE